jgi:hypothetical protein
MPPPCRSLELLRQPRPPRLLVSLPANDLDLAKAAVAGGAEALKVHLNIAHAAAGVHFGSLVEEAAAIQSIVDLGPPVGVVPGDAQKMASPQDLARLAEMGVDFCDVYLAAMPAWLLAQAPLGIMAAVGAADMPRLDRVRSLADVPGLQMIEASIIPHEGYGAALSVGDLSDYTTLVGLMRPVARPVIVPTQRRVTLEDLEPLAATGIAGLLIGAIVTGKEPAALEAATRRYREALAHLR